MFQPIVNKQHSRHEWTKQTWCKIWGHGTTWCLRKYNVHVNTINNDILQSG